MRHAQDIESQRQRLSSLIRDDRTKDHRHPLAGLTVTEIQLFVAHYAQGRSIWRAIEAYFDRLLDSLTLLERIGQ